MSNLEEHLGRIATESDSITQRLKEANISSALAALDDAVEQAGKAWSGSWAGYHSRVYYKDLQPPPPGANFSTFHGLRERFASDTVGDWVEYSHDDLYNLLKDRASNPTFDDLVKLATAARGEIQDLREELLSILNAVCQQGDDSYLDRLMKEAEECESVTAVEFVRHFRPTQIMSTDMAAVDGGMCTPPHIALLCQVKAIRSPFNVATHVAKAARHAARHLQHGIGSKVFKRTGGDKVFIGHGRSSAWKDLKDFIQDRLGLPWDEFNRVPVAGVTNIARLSEMLDEAAIALLVMTAEDEQKDGKVHARMNVIHEAGLFQGRLGFTRAIVVLEEGCEEFSNIQGLGQIRFPIGSISAVFETVRQVLEREGLST